MLKKWDSDDSGGVGRSAPEPRQVAPTFSPLGVEGFRYREMTDLDLMRSVIDLRGDAYAELYRRHAQSVCATARMILGDDSRCEDVVAEVFVGLWFAPQKFDPQRGTLLSFLRIKARGRSIDIVRTESARRRREQADGRRGEQSASPVDGHIFDSEFAVAIRVGVSSLPKTEREAIELAFFAGLTYQAVAIQLGLPEGTVKSRIRAGLKRLQRNDGIRLRRSGSVEGVSFGADNSLQESASRSSA